jgi:hypothetical protein
LGEPGASPRSRRGRALPRGAGSLSHEQHTLPFGSPDDVREEARTRLRTIGRHGGLILGPTHHVQLDTPLENFWAMVETIQGRTPFAAAAAGPRP